MRYFPEFQPGSVSGLLGRLAVLMAVLASSCIGWASPALAAEYKVEVCTGDAMGGNGIELIEASDAPMFFDGCGAQGPDVRQGMRAGVVPEGTSQRWRLISPPSTTIKTLELERSFANTGGQSFVWWVFFTGSGALLDEQLASRPLQSPARIPYTVNSRAVTGELFCPTYSNHTCPGGEFVVDLKDIVATLNDEAAPIMANPALPGRTVRGTVGVSYSAADFGSGISNVTLSVDGVEQQSIHESNGGRCPQQQPYQYLDPCAPSVNSSFPLDTAALSEGQHNVEVAVEDAAGQRTVSDPVTFTVHNAPTSTGRPALEGTAKVGAQLTADTGKWAGSPTAFGYQWLRCPAGVRVDGGTAGCVPIGGAETQAYSPHAADVGMRDLVRVTATNAAGAGSEISAPSDIVAVKAKPLHKPPVVSHVSLTHKSFHVATGVPTSQSGTVLRFSSSKPGQLSIAIGRVRPGKKPKSFGKLAARIKAGRSAVLLTGEIGKRRLPPGRYRVTIRVSDTKGYSSDPVSLPFTILPG